MKNRLLLVIGVVCVIGLVGYLENRDIVAQAQADKTQPELKSGRIAKEMTQRQRQEAATVQAYGALVNTGVERVAQK